MIFQQRDSMIGREDPVIERSLGTGGSRLREAEAFGWPVAA